jgi:L-alanine-DL-glutamate epimerase-like enolase superfamily enzyme
MLTLSYAPYRLLFRTPFGTAHGMRDGTNAVFIRLEQDGVQGYGECTMPPYVEEDQASVIRALHDPELARAVRTGTDALEAFLARPDARLQPAFRSGLYTSYIDLINKEKGTSVSSRSEGPGKALAMVTLGHGAVDDYADRVRQLEPGFPVLKIKLGTPDDRQILKAVTRADERPLLLDANQGWRSLDEALMVLEELDPQRIIGIEQPFAKERWDLHEALTERAEVLVIADESIQGLADLERAPGVFGGVNLKLMKCGGLDQAAEMAGRARELGLKVMLGSMSESSLGCATMLALAGLADLADLDGPWLLSNDPFIGLELENGRFTVQSVEAGFGVKLRNGLIPSWTPIGA